MYRFWGGRGWVFEAHQESRVAEAEEGGRKGAGEQQESESGGPDDVGFESRTD